VIRVGVVAMTLAMRVGLRGLLDDNENSVQVVTEAPTLSSLDLTAGGIDVLVFVADETSSLDYDLLRGGLEGVALLIMMDDDIETIQRLSGHTSFTWGILPTDSTQDELLAT
jgi:hypothetical protein